MNAEAADPVVYRIDADDRLHVENGTWDQFAKSNGGDSVLKSIVEGRKLWRFITDYATSVLYRLIIERVRSRGGSLVFPYRCDSPRRCRFLRMHISSESNGVVRFESDILTEVPRPPMDIFYRTGDRPVREVSHPTMCSVCKSFRTLDRNGMGWRPAEDLTRGANAHAAQNPFSVYNDVCDACRRQILSRLSLV